VLQARTLGGVNLIVQLLSARGAPDAAPPSRRGGDAHEPAAVHRHAVLLSACAVLTELAFDDDNSGLIRQARAAPPARPSARKRGVRAWNRAPRIARVARRRPPAQSRVAGARPQLNGVFVLGRLLLHSCEECNAEAGPLDRVQVRSASATLPTPRSGAEA
jgi:hypothetical protein